MLRAMWMALKAHEETHPNDPFDHERHMPECMITARDDPTTWSCTGDVASSGPSSSSDDGHSVRAA